MTKTLHELQPGAKNWIRKFFSLVEDGHISLQIDALQDKEEMLHYLSNKTGLIYGIPGRFIYSNELSHHHYTQDEELKLLLFESLLFCYLQENKIPFKEEDFILALCDFYREAPISKGIDDWFLPYRKKKPDLQLESILAKRIRVKTPIFGSNYWLNFLSNSFVFLDVILFKDYLQNQNQTFFDHYTEYAKFILLWVIFAAYLDDEVEVKEQRLLWRLLSSAHLDKFHHEEIEKHILNGISENEVKEQIIHHKLLSKVTMELCVFITKATHQTSEKEEVKLNHIGKLLGLTPKEIEEARNLCTTFILENEEDVSVINSDSRIQYFYESFSDRWLHILGRNKDKLVNELKESKELIALIQKSTKQELTKEEKEAVKSQFKDILKSMPSMAIFLLPGGSLLLPLILKIVPDLLPSSFKNNEIEKENP